MRTVVDGALCGEIFEEHGVLSVDDLCRLCAVERTYIVELVDEGVLRATEVDARGWRFSGAALRRARTALRLQRDLEINVPGVALALELLEELERLRGELRVGGR
jgi:chaperone modulatory protein CbpM